MGRAAGIRVAARTAGEQGGLRQSFKEEDGFRFCSMRLKLSLLLLVVWPSWYMGRVLLISPYICTVSQHAAHAA